MSEQNNQNTQESQTPHKRRVRYKGKYPKKFEEKYKELQPEKYKDTIAHVIQKGNTPAGMHISIMVNEILDFLKISRVRLDLMRHSDTVDIRKQCWNV